MEEDNPNLEQVLGIAENKVDAHKLNLLRQKLEIALGGQLSSFIVEDPIIIRRRLVEKLRYDGVSPGMIQSLEQLFMGIIRRAAIRGLLPAPPEGPWTKAWQSVLDASRNIRGTKSLLRSLASWATIQNISPNSIQINDLFTWSETTMVSKNSIPVVEKALTHWLSLPEHLMDSSSSVLLTRLQKKAQKGTIRLDIHQYEI